MMNEILYARALNGNIKVWSVAIVQGKIYTKFGYFGKVLTTTPDKAFYKDKTALVRAMQSKIKAKRRAGYKTLDEIMEYSGQVAPMPIKLEWLQNNLPATNLDYEFNLKPMLCQKYVPGKVKYPAIVQPKYNGLRATLRLESPKGDGDLFSSKVRKPTIRSRSGIEYHLPHITNVLTDKFFIDDVTDLELVFDGELYIHKTSLNIIKSACPLVDDKGVVAKSSNFELTHKVAFVIFDLAIPDVPQEIRLSMLKRHVTTKFPIYVAPHSIVYDDEAILNLAKTWIDLGYEGAVVRELDAEYNFGGRPRSMVKVKFYQDSEFKIIDVIPKPNDPTNCLFVMENDINDETFTCNPMASFTEQESYLANKDNYIGRFATVKYYERSGVKEVPFHANVVTILERE